MVQPPTNHVFDESGTELFEWSDALCTFLGIEAGTRLTQHGVNRRMTEYLFNNDCYLPSQTSRLQTNAELRVLFPGLDTVTTDLNLRRQVLTKHLRTTGQIQIAWPIATSVHVPPLPALPTLPPAQ
jgi:hypothetical protein